MIYKNCKVIIGEKINQLYVLKLEFLDLIKKNDIYFTHCIIPRNKKNNLSYKVHIHLQM